MTEISLRAATAEDADALSRFDVAVWRSCYGRILGPATLRDLDRHPLHDPRFFAAVIDRCGMEEWLWVVEAGGALGGYCHFGACKDAACGYGGEIARIYLQPALRGRGLGTRILAAAAHRLVEEGLTPIRTVVFTENRRAQRLYERLGAQRIGRQLAFTEADGRQLWEFAYGWPDPAPLLAATDRAVGKERRAD